MRPPDRIIRRLDGQVYMRRWHLIPRNRFFNIYLNEFWADDDDRALHDHPWWSWSILLRGMLVEIDRKGSWLLETGCIRLRSARYAHRLVVVGRPAERPLTLFITGPRIRKWGFLTKRGWVYYKEFLS